MNMLILNLIADQKGWDHDADQKLVEFVFNLKKIKASNISLLMDVKTSERPIDSFLALLTSLTAQLLGLCKDVIDYCHGMKSISWIVNGLWK